MQKGDAQLGFPNVLYKNTKAAIEALSGVAEGAIAYATDTNELGSYDGSAWTWGQGGSAVWGAITGTLSDQTDLQTALNAKQPLDADLTAIAGLSPADEDVIQRKSGAWINRTLAQLTTDLTELIQDLIGAMVSGNSETGISVTYDDANGKIDFVTDVEQSEVDTLEANVSALDTAVVIGWITAADTWTRTGNHTFTISGDHTAEMRKGTKIRYKDGGAFEYGVVASSSHAAGTTTVNLIVNTDYEMAAATITDKFFSYSENPEGFPQWFNWSTTWTDLTIGNGTQTLKLKATPNQLFFEIDVILGSTSSIGAGGVSFTPAATLAETQSSGARPPIALATFLDAGTALYFGQVNMISTTSLSPKVYNAAGTYLTQSNITTSVPFTWTTGDVINIQGWQQY